MTIPSPSVPGRTSTLRPGAEPMATRLLANALDHLLARDEDRPARWLTHSFAADVELARIPLRRVVRIRDLPPAASAVPATFTAAVQALARDADFVAVAIRRLEIDRAGSLPPWEDLVRRGVPRAPSPLEVATWFG